MDRGGFWDARACFGQAIAVDHRRDTHADEALRILSYGAPAVQRNPQLSPCRCFDLAEDEVIQHSGSGQASG